MASGAGCVRADPFSGAERVDMGGALDDSWRNRFCAAGLALKSASVSTCGKPEMLSVPLHWLLAKFSPGAG